MLAFTGIASRCTAVIRGTSTPCVVDVMSTKDDAFGVVVPKPTLVCASATDNTNNSDKVKTTFEGVKSDFISMVLAVKKNLRKSGGLIVLRISG